MADRTTKLLLAAIALGLWLQMGANVLTPVPAHAQSAVRDILGDQSCREIASQLGQINVGVRGIERGLSYAQATDSLKRR